MVLSRNIHEYPRTSPDGKTLDQIDQILTDKRRRSNIIGIWSFRGAEYYGDCFWWLQNSGETVSKYVGSVELSRVEI
jgi:hypothetical protein